MSRFVLDAPTDRPGDAKLTLDGVDLGDHIVSAQLRIAHGELNTLTLEIHAPTVLVDGRTVVRLAPGTEALLSRLGWAPPGSNAGQLLARAALLEETLHAVLATFQQQGHPGRPCLSSGWVDADEIARWRAIANQHAQEV